MTLLFRIQNKVYYGWLMVAAFFVIGTMTWGIRASFGVFFKSIESEFELTRAATSAIFSIYMLLGSLVGFSSGWALDRLGPRKIVTIMGVCVGLSLLLTSQASASWQLFVTYSILMAMGTGGNFVVIMSTISRWFDKRRGVALGTASLGAGIGIMVMAPLSAFLISTFDWRTAFLILGVLAGLVIIPLAQLTKKDPTVIGLMPDGRKPELKPESQDLPSANGVQPVGGLSLAEALHTRSFWLLLASWFTFASSEFLIVTHMVPHATDIGFTSAEAAGILSIIGIVTAAGRVPMCTLSDRIGRKETVIIGFLLLGAGTFILVWASTLWALYLFAAIFGLGYTSIGPNMAAFVGETFGLRKIGSLLGVLEFGFGTGAAIGPPVGGAVFDALGSYFWAFLASAITMLIGIILIMMVKKEVELKPGSVAAKTC